MDEMREISQMFPVLEQRLGSPAGTLSGGERKMLAIACGLLREPEVLLVDEPSEGLAPRVIQLLRDKLNALKARGLTLVVTEQNHRLALDVADRVVFLEKGRVAWVGDVRDATRERRLESYLGVGGKVHQVGEGAGADARQAWSSMGT